MIVTSFEFNMFGEKTYLVFDPETMEGAIIDPGMMNSSETDSLFRYISETGIIVRHIILTHLHIDHILGIHAVKGKFNADVNAHPDDLFLGKRVKEQIQMFRLPLDAGNIDIDHNLTDGHRIAIGNQYLTVLAVPGHSPGSISLYSPVDKFVITGDALFRGSIGRTDLPGGDYATLIKSINEKLLTLPDDTTVYPGHGPATTIGDEKKINPYL